jgi:hypothetical protein
MKGVIKIEIEELQAHSNGSALPERLIHTLSGQYEEIKKETEMLLH